MTVLKKSLEFLREPIRRVPPKAMGLALLIALPSITALTQTAPEAPAAKGEAEGKKAARGEQVIDPRTKAATERARQLRIERQTEITSSLPTESTLLSSLAIPEGLVGDRGLRYGRFVVQPSLTVSAAFTDNANADADDREEEFSVNAQGLVRAQSVLARHQFGFDATGTASHSFQEDNDDFFDWSVGADGRFDLTRKSSVSSRVDYSLDTEDDSSVDADGETNDVEAVKGTVGYQFKGNKLGYLFATGVSRQDFSGDGSADRDNTTFDVNQRIDHRTTKRLTLFATPQYAYTDFDQDIGDDGDESGAQNATILFGADYAFRAPLVLSAAVGYTRLFFDDPDENDADSAVASGTLVWQASPLTSFELSASHNLELSTLDDADARTDTAVQLNTSRQIGLNTALLGEFGTTYSDFEDIDRTDVDIRAGVGIARRLTDNVFFSMAYQYEQRFSDDDVAEFYENEVLVGLSVLY